MERTWRNIHMRILAIDDEAPALESLKQELCKAVPNAEIHTYRNPEELLEYAKNNQCDIAFLDVQIKGITGLEIAMDLKKINPRINIIFVTGYSQYLKDAFQLRASGYLLKPATKNDIIEEMNNLRNSPLTEYKRVRIQCFGEFEIFIDGEPINFKYRREKEILAILVDRKGVAVKYDLIRAVLWENKNDTLSLKSQFRNMISDINKTLAEQGVSDIIIKRGNSVAIAMEKVSCDFFDYIRGDIYAVNKFNGEYMEQYSWAEFTKGSLI